MLTERAQELLSLRGIDLEAAARFGIASTFPDREGNWVEIPYTHAGTTVLTKRRSLSGQRLMSYDERPRNSYWNADCLDDPSLREHDVIVCQDELDAIALLQSGFPRVVAIPDMPDDRPKAERFGFIEGETGRIDSKSIVLAMRADEHGHGLVQDLAIRFGKARCKGLVYPLRTGGASRLQSIGELLAQDGEDAVAACVTAAHWLFRDGVYKMSELPPIPEPAVHRIGMNGLDNHFAIRRGDFIVVTGIPSHGKSSVLNDICCRMAAQHRWRIAFASFEQMPQTDHQRNLRAWFNGNYRDGDAAAWMDNYFRFLVPQDDDLPTLDWVIDKSEQAVIQHNCDMLVLDPWNEVDHSRSKEMSLTEYTGYAIKQFKRLAREMNITVVIAAHPAKMKKDDNGKYAPPTLYDISDSAHWFNKADLGMTVYRPDTEKNETHIIVNKVRYQHVIGQPGVVNTHYLYDQRRYECIDMK